MKIITKNQKETIELGEKISRKLRGGEILALEGDLGAGKTTLIKGIAKGLGIKKAITSPTFVLMKVYRIRNHAFAVYPSTKLRMTAMAGRQELGIRNFIHIDAYRVKDWQDLRDIGIEEYLGEKNSVVVIEWADRVKKLFWDKKVIWLMMGLGKKENEREIIIMK
jgi:tRNA threonylcarbamoyladenosine biosynthesis protein TsaE